MLVLVSVVLLLLSLLVLIEVFRTEIVTKVDALIVQKFLGLLLFLLITLVLGVVVCVLGVVLGLIALEPQQSVNIGLARLGGSRMRHIQMCLQLRFCLERNVAFLTARVIWAHEMRA